MVVLLALAAAELVSARGGFLDHLPKVSDIAKSSPAKIAEEVAKTAGDAAKDVEKAAGAAAAEPEKTAVEAKAAVEQVVDGSAKEDAAKALGDAGDTLKRAGAQAAKANTTSVAKNVEHAADKVLPSGLRPEDVKDASKGELADDVRKATPKAAATIERVGHKVSDEIAKEVPRAADLVNNTGNGIIDRLFGPIPKGSTGLPPEVEDQVRAVGVAPILGCLLLVLVVGGTAIGSRLRKGNAARSPVLLTPDGEAADYELTGTVHHKSREEASFSRF